MAVLNEEQSLLQDAARSWAQKKNPISAFRRMRNSVAEFGYERNAWNEMVEMGWPAVLVPGEYGGVDFGCLSLGLILEQTGRTLTASPLLASALMGASAFSLGGSEAQKSEWLPSIADGSVIVTLAIDEGPHHAPEKIATRVSDGKLCGRKVLVLEGMAAEAFVVSARVGGGSDGPSRIELFVVSANAPGVTRERLSLIDSRGVANITFDNVAVGDHAKLNGGYELLEKVLDRARAGLAAEMLGAATQAFEITVDYLKTRVQFGQPIGSFQALQHRAAGMLTHLELARSSVEAALMGIDDDSTNVPELVSIAKAKMGDTLHLISNEMIQMHGGIGMTDAHDAGFYLKRARACEAIFGNQAYHRDRYAQINGY